MFFFNSKYYLIFAIFYSISFAQINTLHLSSNYKDTIIKANYSIKANSDIANILNNQGIIIDTVLYHKVLKDTYFIKTNNYKIVRYNFDSLQNYYNQIINLQNNGYPLANFILDSIQYYNNSHFLSLTTYYSINFFKKYFIKELDIYGLNITTNNTINKIVKIQPGDNFDLSKINNISNNLKRYNYLSVSREPIIILDTNGNAFLKLFFNETKSTFFDGLIGFSKSQNSQGEFFGKFNFIVNNLFGTARKFHFEWNKPKKNFFDLSIEYREPWTFGYDISTYIKINQNRFDTLFINNRYNILFEYFFNNFFSFAYGLNYESSIPNHNVNFFLYPKYFNNSHTFQIKLDKLDNDLMPKEGYYINLAIISISKNNLSLGKNFNQQSVNLDFIYTSNIILDIYYYTRFRTMSKFGKNITPNDFDYVGGFKSLRGYEEYQFRGNIINLSNNEFRFYTNNKSYFFTLFDMSLVQIYNTILSNTKEFLFSYGVGTVFSTKNGIFSVSLSIPHNQNFNNLKIHFGYINNF